MVLVVIRILLKSALMPHFSPSRRLVCSFLLIVMKVTDGTAEVTQKLITSPGRFSSVQWRTMEDSSAFFPDRPSKLWDGEAEH